MAETSQAPNVVTTYKDPWTKQLAEASAATGGTRTISSATVTASDGATIPNKTVQTTAVLFRLDPTNVTGTPKYVTVTTTVTLDNGDTEAHSHQIQITNT